MKNILLVISVLGLMQTVSAQGDADCAKILDTIQSYHGDYQSILYYTIDSEGHLCAPPLTIYTEPAINSFAVVTDQDRFVSRFNEDRNYTMGIGFRLAGIGTNKWWYITPLFQYYADKTCMKLLLRKQYDPGFLTVKQYGIMLGASAFTPETIGDTILNRNDRPYASDVYIQGSRTYVLERPNKKKPVAFHTDLSVGRLGTGVAEFVQTGIHSGGRVHNPDGREDPRGWSLQMANGGATSFRYAFDAVWNMLEKQGASDKLLVHDYLRVIPKFNYYCNITTGFSTGLYNYFRVGSSGKLGHFRGRFYDTNNEIALGSSMLAQPGLLSLNIQEQLKKNMGRPYSSMNNFQWALFYDVSLHYWLYNAMIQGWYGQDLYSYTYKNIQPVTLTASIGGIVKFNQLSVKASAHLRTNEMRNVSVQRTHWWGQVGIYFDLVR